LAGASEQEIDPGRHGLPDRASSLHRIINSRISNFERLLEALKDAGSPRLREFARLLT
jgi:hypothetical protein